jgi:DNA repair exonuclease SbcCD nuclease subunit
MFKKILWVTDIHFGRGGNSVVANEDNINFLKWSVDRALSWGAETLVYGGDWHDCRHSLGVSTIHYSLQGLDILNNSFKNIFFIPGNHDLLYRDRRDVASIEFAKYQKNINIVRAPTTIDDITLLPWLVGEEVKKVKHIKSRYVFAHLEMPGFMMNAKVELPDAPHLAKLDDFENVDTVFTGHFHMRQQKGRVLYTGNAMPFNFSDVNDDQRGIMLLQHGHDPIFESWAEQPLFVDGKLTDILNNADNILKPKMTLKAYVDIPLTQEEMQEIKDTLVAGYDLRKLEIINTKDDTTDDYQSPVVFKNVDQMVLEGLQSVQSTNINVNKLSHLYINKVSQGLVK